jgi:clan AA aspartic protease
LKRHPKLEHRVKITGDKKVGQITEKVIVKKFVDIAKLSEGLISEDAVRTVEIEAIVNTGAALLCLPPSVIAQLGLISTISRDVITANGAVKRRVFGGAAINIQGRETLMGVMENDETTPPLIGYLILEDLDFVVEPKAQKLTPNPAHDGKWISDLL